MKKEIKMGSSWKPIPGYEDYYINKSTTEIYDSKLKKMVMQSNKPSKGNATNYKLVWLRDKARDKGRVNKLVHRLMAETFIPNPDNKPHVNHKNSDGFNNKVSNLEWSTHTENMRHSCKVGRCNNGKNRKGIPLTKQASSIMTAREWIGGF